MGILVVHALRRSRADSLMSSNVEGDSRQKVARTLHRICVGTPSTPLDQLSPLLWLASAFPSRSRPFDSLYMTGCCLRSAAVMARQGKVVAFGSGWMAFQVIESALYTRFLTSGF